jgi:hypothetical protein
MNRNIERGIFTIGLIWALIWLFITMVMGAWNAIGAGVSPYVELPFYLSAFVLTLIALYLGSKNWK